MVFHHHYIQCHGQVMMSLSESNHGPLAHRMQMTGQRPWEEPITVVPNVFLQDADSPNNWCWDSATLSRIMTIVILGRKYYRNNYVIPACHSARDGPFHSDHDAHMFFIVPIHEPCISYYSIMVIMTRTTL